MRVKRVCALSFPFALAMGWLAGAGSAMAAACDGSTDSLGNGSFETPVVSPDTYSLLAASQVPPWQTTDGAGQIEIWGTGFLGVPASDGNAFAELNANTAGTLYQDVVSVGGESMTWSLVHRGRGGDDTMEVLIGDANDADVNGSTGWDSTSGPLTDGVSAWGSHTGTYTVPAGQTCTRFAFRAVATGSGNDSIGNFLDAVEFSVTIPATDPPPDDPVPTDPSGPAGPTDPPAPAPTPPPTDAVTGAFTSGKGFDVSLAALVGVASVGAASAAISRRRRRVR